MIVRRVNVYALYFIYVLLKFYWRIYTMNQHFWIRKKMSLSDFFSWCHLWDRNTYKIIPYLHTSIRLLNLFALNGNNKSIFLLPSINTLFKQLKVFFSLCSRNLIIPSSTNFVSLWMFYISFVRSYNVFVKRNMYVYAMSVNMAHEWKLLWYFRNTIE